MLFRESRGINKKCFSRTLSFLAMALCRESKQLARRFLARWEIRSPSPGAFSLAPFIGSLSGPTGRGQICRLQERRAFSIPACFDSTGHSVMKLGPFLNVRQRSFTALHVTCYAPTQSFGMCPRTRSYTWHKLTLGQRLAGAEG